MRRKKKKNRKRSRGECKEVREGRREGGRSSPLLKASELGEV
jgi:hypothetical protein